MVDVVSPFVQNVGALVCNIAGRGYIVRVELVSSVLGGQTLYISISDMKAKRTLREALLEREVSDIVDISIISEALIEKLKRSGS